ncbi:hypothetical protein GW17_00000774 [Ensete ventricosum]|nr:hypothetical protein GW17_00000774 [Ensete ventricosum]
MTSSPSLTIFGFTSSSSSSVPPPRVESCHPSGPAGDRSEPSSSSSGILTRSDIKAIRAMEIMKSHHDFDSTLSIESLVLIRKRFSILDEYALHAPLLEQCSYHEFPGGYSLSVDALEARLRFPLYPGWDFGLEWFGFSINNVPPYLTNEESVQVGRLRDILPSSRAITNLTEQWLIEAGISSVSRGMSRTPFSLTAPDT